MIADTYAALIWKKELTDDPAQRRVVDVLQELQERVFRNESAAILLGRKLGLGRRPEDFRGLYLWGSVGRGKTFLMDLFFDTLQIKAKRRIHFHRMMSEVHARLKNLRDQSDPLDSVAGEIAAETRVLCLDEFFVSDIGDAMILDRLLQGLFDRDVILVTTSNVPPADLYANGLQRDRFLPAIALLENRTQVLQMDGDDDYRLRLMQAAGTYLPADDDSTHEKLASFFDNIAAGRSTEHGSIEILGRPIPIVRCAKGIAWFDFSDICGGPRSQQDYIEIARWYQTIIVSNVPILTIQSEDPARRFVALVDEFYDRRVKLIVSAAASVDELYQGRRLAFEFARTASRLVEMQSDEYLHLAHIA
ncbi:MAG: AFG1 family ATPase [Gammaproteobacteria bacterium]|nr:AFG1 family ATPase [Gammaproteobacteria bacterium]